MNIVFLVKDRDLKLAKHFGLQRHTMKKISITNKSNLAENFYVFLIQPNFSPFSKVVKKRQLKLLKIISAKIFQIVPVSLAWFCYFLILFWKINSSLSYDGHHKCKEAFSSTVSNFTFFINYKNYYL